MVLGDLAESEEVDHGQEAQNTRQAVEYAGDNRNEATGEEEKLPFCREAEEDGDAGP